MQSLLLNNSMNARGVMFIQLTGELEGKSYNLISQNREVMSDVMVTVKMTPVKMTLGSL